MKGDQMTWWIFNDNTEVHAASKGLPMSMEVHASMYAYNRGTTAGKMQYTHPRSSTQNPETNTKEIRIIDAMGRTIEIPVIHTGNTFEIDVRTLASGLYSVVYTNNGVTTVHTFSR